MLGTTVVSASRAPAQASAEARPGDAGRKRSALMARSPGNAPGPGRRVAAPGRPPRRPGAGPDRVAGVPAGYVTAMGVPAEPVAPFRGTGAKMYTNS